MIADVVNVAIAGIGFCHAAGSLIFRRKVKVGATGVISENWTARRNEDRERTISASAREF